MTGYDAGTAFLQVIPSFRGVEQTIESEVKKWKEQVRRGIEPALPEAFRAGARSAGAEGAKAGEEFGGAFGRTVRTRIEAALKALPKVELKADSTDADVKIAAIRRELEDLHSKRIGVDIDEGLALAQLQRLQGELDRLSTEDPSVAVRINSARASEELAAIQAEVNHLDGETATVHVRVDHDSIPGGVGGLGGFGGGGLGLGSAGIIAAPLAVPFGAAAIGGVAGTATAAAAGAAGLGVLAIGLSGISDAVKDITAANMAAGRAATDSGAAQIRAALAVASAERGLKAAQESLSNARANAADAAITAAERVESALAAQAAAERNLSTAQQQQKDAQQALTDARKTAAQQIEDLTQAVADGQLSARQADLDVQRARLNLQGVNSNPQSTALERQQAQLDFDTAVQRQKDLATQQQRTIDAQQAAVRAGVNGAAVVVQAQQGVVAANQAVVAAYTAIQDAAQGVADAQRAQATQARQSAYAIEQAQNGILNAQAAVQSAQLQTAAAGDAVNQRLTAMSAPLKAFATFVNDTLKPAFGGVRDAIQASLLPELQTGLTNLLPVLPGLTRFVAGLAKVMGDLFVEASRALTGSFWTGFFDFVSRVAGPTLDTLAHIVGDVVTGFAGLLQAFYPVSKGIGDGILHLTDRFADFATHLDSNSSFQSFLAYVKREGPAVGHFLSNLAGIAGKLFEAFAPLGALMLDASNAALDLINQLGPQGLLLGLGALGVAAAALAGPEAVIVAGLVALAGAAVYAYEHFKPLHDFIHDKLLPVLQGAFHDALDGLRTGFKHITDAVHDNRSELAELGHGLRLVLDFVVQHVLPIFGTQLRTTFTVLGIIIGSAIWQVSRMVDIFNTLWHTGVTVKNQIVGAFNTVVGFIAHLPDRITTVSRGMWDGIKVAFRAALNWIIDAWNGLQFKIPGFDPPGPGPTFGGFTLGVPHIDRLAKGGPAQAGTPYWVGDGGTPELFVPGQSGQVLNLLQVSAAISGLVGGGTLSHAQLASASTAGPTVGEYHQHFHRYPDEQAHHAAAVGNRRLLQQLSS